MTYSRLVSLRSRGCTYWSSAALDLMSSATAVLLGWDLGILSFLWLPTVNEEQ